MRRPSGSGAWDRLVVVPTFNEIENLEAILDRLAAAVPLAHALVVDDASPDGTGELADKLAAADPRVHVLHRGGKQGIGPAYVAGFRWGREQGFDVLVEMDADGSHDPADLPRLLDALEDADLVLGSRYVDGGRVEDWPWRRRALSRGGNLYTRLALRLPLSDATGGFRAARGPAGPAAARRRRQRGVLLPGRLGLAGVARGCPGGRGPDHLRERQFGRSKMSRSIVEEALVRVTVWGLRDRFADRMPGRVRRSVPALARDGARSGATR